MAEPISPVSTYAQAQANAQAILETMESSPPSTCPFVAELTDKMVELQFIYNADIMELAEKRVMIEEQISKTQDEIRMLETGYDPGAQIFAIEALNLRLDEEVYDLEEARNAFPEKVLAEIEEVKTEYRQLAENLCSERTAYFNARQRLGDVGLSYEGLAAVRGRSTGSYLPGYFEDGLFFLLEGDDLITLPESEIPVYHGVVDDAELAYRYEIAYASYKLIEAGQSFVTNGERLQSFFTALGRALVIEFITFGAVKYITLVRVAAEAVEQLATMALRKSSAVLATAGERLAARFVSLPKHVRDDLDDIRMNRERDNFEPDTRGANSEAQTPVAASQVDEVCVLC